MLSERERALKVLRELVEDTGDIMPGWSYPIGAYDYGCSYCGALSTMDDGGRYAMTHDDDCPVAVGAALLGLQEFSRLSAADDAGDGCERE